MAPGAITRRLAAIVIADVVGYTRHMERDEGGTHVHLKEIRAQFFDPTIVAHGGHIVREAGDGLLLEFKSAGAALRASIEVQRAIGSHNRSCPEKERLEFRIGINLGDIIVDGDDIAGDGVNIASRLETLSEPGGICVSASVRDLVRESLDVGFVDIGEQQVKNIERPIRVYRVALQRRPTSRIERTAERFQAFGRSLGWRRLLVGGVVLGIAGGAVLLWQSSPTAISGPTPPPLSIAVLPFDAPSGTAAETQLAGVITTDLAAGLARARWAEVVPRSVIATSISKPFDMSRIRRELNVRYVVSGAVRIADQRIVVDAQLIDAGNGTQAWSDRLVLGAVTAELAAGNLVAPLTLRVRDALFKAEERRANEAPVAAMRPIDFVLRAEAAWSRDPNTTKGALDARKLFDQALRADPSLVPALLGRARTLWYEVELDPNANRDSLVLEMDELTKRAVSIDGNDSRAWSYRAQALTLQRRWAAALSANAKAHELDPTRANVLSQRAELMINTGYPTEALTLVDKALALDPSDPQDTGWAMLQRCRAYLALGRYDDAIMACEQSAAQDDWWVDHLYLTAAYAQRAQMSKAREEMAALLRQRPGFSIASLKALQLSDNPAYLLQTESRLFDGLRKAGMPEN